MGSRPIKLLGEPIQNEDNKAADGTIKPGHLITLDGNGDWIRHNVTSSATVAPIFALEREEMGQGIDVLYSAGDYVKAGHFANGDHVNAVIASGQDIAKGARLESAGNGTLRAFSSGFAIAIATHAVDNSAGPGDARISATIIV
jgi:hypothetical protein